MKLNLHPSAIENFNNKALALLDKVKLSNRSIKSQSIVHPDKVPDNVINENDLTGNVSSGEVDYYGNIVSQYFIFNNNEYGISGNDYQSLRLVSERIQSKPEIRNILGLEFVQERIFTWVSDKFMDKQNKTFIEYLESEADKEVNDFTTWIPVANLQVESTIPICGVTIKMLTKKVFDEWESSALNNLNSNCTEENIKQKYDNLRSKYQGLAYIVNQENAEFNYAFNLSIKKAQIALSILSIYSPALLKADFKYVSSISGSEIQSNIECLLLDNELKLGFSGIVSDLRNITPLILTSEIISNIRNQSLDRLSELISKKDKSKFETSLTNSILLYSKAAYSSEPIEKIVYILSSLESLLLKDKGEFIQNSLAERIAFFITDSPSERKRKIKLLKFIYSMRSDYLHHGESIEELKSTSEFLKTIWHFYNKLILVSNLYSTKEKLIEEIENLKYK